MFRRMAAASIELFGSEKVVDTLVDAFVEVAAASKPARELGKKLAHDFLRQSQSQGQGQTKPWLPLKAIYEFPKEDFAFKPYNPCKGEIQTLLNSNMEQHTTTKAAAALLQPWLLKPAAATQIYNIRLGLEEYKFYCVMRGEEVESFNSRGGKQDGAKLQELHTSSVGSSQGWIASYNDRTARLSLWNPLSGRRVELPPPPPHEPIKVVITCPRPEDDDCRAVMSYGLGRLAYCCPASSKEWKTMGTLHDDHYGLRCVRSYDDFQYSSSSKRLLALSQGKSSSSMKLERWDLENDQLPRLDEERLLQLDEDEDEDSRKDWCRAVRSVVVEEHSNSVYIVTRYVSTNEMDIEEETIDLDVDRVDKGRRLKRMKGSLGGLAMFVGMKNNCFAVAASEHPGLEADSIYFTTKGGRIGVFDYISRKCSFPDKLQIQCSNSSTATRHPPLWFTPTLYGAFLTN